MDWRTTLPSSTETNEVLDVVVADASAEERFRQAFVRLKNNFPKVLPKGSPVSQNNIAKEAGCVPSALKKSRFPLLVMEIQEWIKSQKVSCPVSARQKLRDVRNKNRSNRQKAADLKLQRDVASGLLSDANLRIVQLTEEVASLRARLDAIRPSAGILMLPTQDI